MNCRGVAIDFKATVRVVSTNGNRGRSVPSNYAFERPGEPSVSARVRPSRPFMPSASLNALRPAAQRER